MLMATLAILLTLILVVGVHELGHAAAACLFQVTITKVSIGFGKPLLQWRSKTGCEWAWGMWPLGGYVQLLNTRVKSVDPGQLDQCFDKKPIGTRIVILLAGAFANFCVAWLAFIIAFSMGINYKTPLIQTVKPNSIAAMAGISPNDEFVAIANHNTTTWQDVGMSLIASWGSKDLAIQLKQKNASDLKTVHLNLSHIKFSPKDKSLLESLGMTPDQQAGNRLVQAKSIIEAMQMATVAIGSWLCFFMMVLKQLLLGHIPFSVLLGPIGLFASSVASLAQGIVVFTYFIATLSTAVAFLNLFPIPGLDGGSIVYALIEKVRGKPVSIAFEVLLHRLLLIAAVVLLVNLISNDLLRFYS